MNYFELENWTFNDAKNWVGTSGRPFNVVYYISYG